MLMTHGWWMVGEALFWFAFLGLVVWLVATFAPNPDHASAGHRDAVAVLEERFAHGDISVDEFRERRAELGQRHQGR